MGCASSTPSVDAQQVDVQMDGPLPVGWSTHDESPWGEWFLHEATGRRSWARPVLLSSDYAPEPQLYTFDQPAPLGIILYRTVLSDTGGALLVVQRVVHDSAAAQLGVPMGGALHSLNGASAAGMTEAEAARLLDSPSRPLAVGIRPFAVRRPELTLAERRALDFGRPRPEPPPPDEHDAEKFPLAAGFGTRLLPPPGWSSDAPRVPVEGEEELLAVWARLTFPSCWRSLPALPWTAELVQLPFHFGLGSATLRPFIVAQKAAEQERAKRVADWHAAFTAAVQKEHARKGCTPEVARRRAMKRWAMRKRGPPPLPHDGPEFGPPIWPRRPRRGGGGCTRDLRPLPFGGMGSGTVASEQEREIEWASEQARLGFPPFLGYIDGLVPKRAESRVESPPGPPPHPRPLNFDRPESSSPSPSS
jgi:hypothetical protein